MTRILIALLLFMVAFPFIPFAKHCVRVGTTISQTVEAVSDRLETLAIENLI